MLCVTVKHDCLKHGEVAAYSDYITIFFIFKQPLEDQSGRDVKELAHDAEHSKIKFVYFSDVHREHVLVLAKIWGNDATEEYKDKYSVYFSLANSISNISEVLHHSSTETLIFTLLLCRINSVHRYERSQFTINFTTNNLFVVLWYLEIVPSLLFISLLLNFIAKIANKEAHEGVC